MAIRSLSIHAHFYQPPREDPLTGGVPNETGAAPYANWNERILAECYRPNAELRNFERISFNVGPTLFSWLEAHDPATCQKIVEQDHSNIQRYGVGNAMAQAYNHTILPLASYHDKVTQITWGIADFEHRFKHKPQGMWLPETAVDSETLEVLANQGIKFTILAPWQAESPDIDPTEPYIVPLSNGQQMIVFFFQRDLSTQVSFDSGSTVNADRFAEFVLQPRFREDKARRGEPQLLLVASDGELYGHHQFLRDHFLARLVDGACSQIGIQPTYPAFWLASYPAKKTISIREKTSWSCHHGVARWTGECACTSGSSRWKIHLRRAFERLANELDQLYFETLIPWVPDPWLIRDRYIHVLLGHLTVEQLVIEMSGGSLTTPQTRQIHLLLEAQRERQRMFTSCGWFFEDFDRVEPRYNLAYAAQAVRLARLATGNNLENLVLEDLQHVSSYRSGLRAEGVFKHHLQRAETVDSEKVGYADQS